MTWKLLPQDRAKRREAISGIRRMVAARYRAIILPTLTCGALLLAVWFQGGPEDGSQWWVLFGLLVLMWVVLYAGGVFFAGTPRR